MTLPKPEPITKLDTDSVRSLINTVNWSHLTPKEESAPFDFMIINSIEYVIKKGRITVRKTPKIIFLNLAYRELDLEHSIIYIKNKHIETKYAKLPATIVPIARITVIVFLNR